MEEWMAMRAMKEAHVVGLRLLDDLEGAVVRLAKGEGASAMDTFEAMLRFFETDLSMHFRHEENALFPVLAKQIGRAGPIDAMVEEHDSLWRSIEMFEELVGELRVAGATGGIQLSPRIEKVATHIKWILSSHIQKEDSMLFPLAERVLDQSGRSQVDESVDMLERMYGAGAETEEA